ERVTPQDLEPEVFSLSSPSALWCPVVEKATDYALVWINSTKDDIDFVAGFICLNALQLSYACLH
ncbi:hypothetical protein ACJX0J_036651, partial [Zea mays]